MHIFRHTRKEKGALKRLNLCYYGADEEIRTLDLLITNQLLYQLSYCSDTA